MASTSVSWLPWALASAAFAALTAIFAKVGIASINADLATLIRTVVISAALVAMVSATGQWPEPGRSPAGLGCFSSFRA
jgi:bacterial/archaeal transporter family protein